jgi:non-heme chloroperoxidase
MTCKHGPAVLPLLLTFQTAGAQGTEAQWRDPSPHSVQLVTVEKDVQIEVLDWGGSGRAVVLLAGLGNTSHVFDELALKLREHVHVYGITRRGFGASSKPQTGFDVERLVEDIASTVRTLKLERPILVGHSFAGEELTELGARYPNVVGGLIYLDAAADRTASVPEEYMTLFRTLPPAGSTQAQAYASYAAMAAYAKQPESEVRQRFREGADGKLTSRVEPRVVQAAAKGIKRPAYTSVAAPTLAFFAIPASPEQLFPWVETQDPLVKKNMTRLYELNLENIRRQISVYKSEVAVSRAVELHGASHNIVVSNETDVLSGILEFVAGLPKSE